mgnify:CR=1 FL=1
MKSTLTIKSKLWTDFTELNVAGHDHDEAPTKLRPQNKNTFDDLFDTNIAKYMTDIELCYGMGR